MTDREKFISSLVEDIRTVKHTHVCKSAMVWLVSAFSFTALLAYFTGPYRSSIGHDLLSSLQFVTESMIGFLGIALLIYTAFGLTIPSQKQVAKRLVWPFTILTIWIGAYLLGLIYPALEPSMSGKREYCYYETFVYALPLLLTSLLWARKQWPLHPKVTGLLLGLAAGAVPALIMQFACMYEPLHILTRHILPGLSVGLLGVLMGSAMLRTTIIKK